MSDGGFLLQDIAILRRKESFPYGLPSEGAKEEEEEEEGLTFMLVP